MPGEAAVNCLAAAKVLDELMLDLINRGIGIPPHVTRDLQSGRSLAGISLRQTESRSVHSHEDSIAMKTLSILQNVEMNLLSLAQAGADTEYADAWQKRINEAYLQAPDTTASKLASGFISGMPRGIHWIRLKTTELENVPALGELLDNFDLAASSQEEGWQLIRGKKDNIASFLREIRNIIGKNGV